MGKLTKPNIFVLLLQALCIASVFIFGLIPASAQTPQSDNRSDFQSTGIINNNELGGTIQKTDNSLIQPLSSSSLLNQSAIGHKGLVVQNSTSPATLEVVNVPNKAANPQPKKRYVTIQFVIVRGIIIAIILVAANYAWKKYKAAKAKETKVADTTQLTTEDKPKKDKKKTTKKKKRSNVGRKQR